MKTLQFRAWVFCILLLGLGLGATRASAVYAQGAQLRTLPEGARPGEFKVVVMTPAGPVVESLEDIPPEAQFYFSPDAEVEISQRLSGEYETRVLTSNHSRSRRELEVVLEIWSSDGGRRYGYRASESGVVPLGRAVMDRALMWDALGEGLKWFLLAMLLLPLGMIQLKKSSGAPQT